MQFQQQLCNALHPRWTFAMPLKLRRFSHRERLVLEVDCFLRWDGSLVYVMKRVIKCVIVCCIAKLCPPQILVRRTAFHDSWSEFCVTAGSFPASTRASLLTKHRTLRYLQGLLCHYCYRLFLFSKVEISCHDCDAFVIPVVLPW